MSRVTITADHAELIARRLGEAMSNRVRRRAVTTAGKSARKELPQIIAGVYGSSKAAVGARGRAPSPGAEDPIYRLTLNRQIKLEKLRAAKRKFKRRRRDPLGQLRIVQPQESGEPGVDRFAALRGDGKAEFILPPSRGRRRRRVGGPNVSLRKNPLIRARRDRIVEDLAQALKTEIEAALKRR